MPRFAEVPAVVSEPLTLPVAGADGVVRDYVILPASAGDYITMSIFKANTMGAQLSELDREKIQHLDAVTQVWALALGPDVLDQVIRDGVPANEMRRMSQTAFYWHTADGDMELADLAWSGKALPLTSGPTRSVRDGAAESTTPDQNSGSGTTTPTDGSRTDLAEP
jgi:hypothetical protein